MKLKTATKVLSLFTLIVIFCCALISKTSFAAPIQCAAQCDGGIALCGASGGTCIATNGMGCVVLQGPEIVVITTC